MPKKHTHESHFLRFARPPGWAVPYGKVKRPRLLTNHVNPTQITPSWILLIYYQDFPGDARGNYFSVAINLLLRFSK